MVNQKKRAIAWMMLVRRLHALALVGDAAHDFRGRVRALAEPHQRVGEMPVGVHRHVAGDVVENVGLGKIIELVGRRMVMVVGNSRFRRQSKNIKAGTYPLTAFA